MIIVLLIGLLSVVNAREVTVEMHGILYCGGTNKQIPVYMELREHDWIKDDMLGWTTVMTPDKFTISGKEQELFDIHPFLIIRHSCNGHLERLIVDFGHIRSNVLVNFGELDLENPTLVTEMQAKFNEEVKNQRTENNM
ncbi:hypothetical protein GCK32_004127 [Trichostrongylus colubriformis]|uniref:Transthyretin-like family protein n=1 Tax=Trichostrongylus colubriformis TaxID=6319 RepID=A0AAN8IU49_TRICO